MSEPKHRSTHALSFSNIAKTLTLVSIVLASSSCAPSLYRVNIQFEPSKAMELTGTNIRTPITVAVFNDARSEGDDLSVGKVVKKRKILYNISATGNSSLEHVRFSEEHLERQINGALSYAIEDIFSSNAVRKRMNISPHPPPHTPPLEDTQSR
jgi:hypothetical protein